MRISKRTLGAGLATGAAALSMALAVGAIASDSSSDGDGSLLEQSLAGSMPGDPAFHGVSAGGAPWVLDRGEVRLNADGDLDLRVEGLVIPKPAGDNTPGPVKTISASLYCGADADMTAADTSRQATLSKGGDARIRDRSFDVPDSCLAPVILVHPNGSTTVYIAVDGWRM